MNHIFFSKSYLLYQANDIKRALLTYDKVYLISPDESDVIPPIMHFDLAMGFPRSSIVIEGVGEFTDYSGLHKEVRLLGMVTGYNEAFEILLKE